MKPAEHPALKRLTPICLALPKTARTLLKSHAQFTVGKRTFAYFLDSHHSDGILSVACKVLPGDNAELIRAAPDRFYMPDYLGARGWVALRLDVPDVDWDEVAELVKGSYRLVSAKRPSRAG